MTSLGVVENVFLNEKNVDDLYRQIGKRTVYSKDEIDDYAQGEYLVILFMEMAFFATPPNLGYLKDNDIIKGAPQSIMELKNDAYEKLKGVGLSYGNTTIN